MIRTAAAAEKRQQRDEQVRSRALAKRLNELAKLSELEQARTVVESYEAQIAELLSVHKEQGEAWDWEAAAASLPPPEPRRGSDRES